MKNINIKIFRITNQEIKNKDGDNLNRLLNFEGRGNRNLIYHEILARVIASLDVDQKKKFHKRLNFFISSLDKIIKNQK